MKWGGGMNILIADDQAEVRSALKVLLEHENIQGTLDEAEDINNLVLKMKYTCPDLLLLDWELSNRQMADVIPVLKQLVPGLRIIALSVRPEAERAAMDAGVDTFASKGENPDKLVSYIKDLTHCTGHPAR